MKANRKETNNENRRASASLLGDENLEIAVEELLGLLRFGAKRQIQESVDGARKHLKVCLDVGHAELCVKARHLVNERIQLRETKLVQKETPPNDNTSL